MTDTDDTVRPSPSHPVWRPEELLGRRVRFRAAVGRVEEVDVVSAPHLVILTRDGLLRVSAPEWGEIEVLC